MRKSFSLKKIVLLPVVPVPVEIVVTDALTVVIVEVVALVLPENIGPQ